MKTVRPISFEIDQLLRLQEIARANPAFWHNGQPSLAAVVRYAVDHVFLPEESAPANCDSEQTQTA